MVGMFTSVVWGRDTECTCLNIKLSDTLSQIRSPSESVAKLKAMYPLAYTPHSHIT